MSLQILDDFNSAMRERYGDAIEEVIVSEYTFNTLITDLAALRNPEMFDLSKPGPTNIKFKDIIITKSVKSQIEQTERQITQLQEKLNKLKTRTGF